MLSVSAVDKSTAAVARTLPSDTTATAAAAAARFVT